MVGSSEEFQPHQSHAYDNHHKLSTRKRKTLENKTRQTNIITASDATPSSSPPSRIQYPHNMFSPFTLTPISDTNHANACSPVIALEAHPRSTSKEHLQGAPPRSTCHSTNGMNETAKNPAAPPRSTSKLEPPRSTCKEHLQGVPARRKCLQHLQNSGAMRVYIYIYMYI